MAGYAGFQRARRSTRPRWGMRRSGGGSRRMGYKKGNYQRRPRFATVGFVRDVEKKYCDKTYMANSEEVLTGATNAGIQNSNGVTYISNEWGNYYFGSTNTSVQISNDMLKGVGQGTTARGRIGNKIRVNYVKGAFTFTAAGISTTFAPQDGETIAGVSAAARHGYLRTTYRFVIVKDTQVNSTDTHVTWRQVFDTFSGSAGVHSELNISNMGRFLVVEDKTFTVDADDPQKTVPFNVGGSRIGNVRYNGTGGDTGTEGVLTDKGLYVIYAAFVMGVVGFDVNNIVLPSPVGHSRMCFTDE